MSGYNGPLQGVGSAGGGSDDWIRSFMQQPHRPQGSLGGFMQQPFRPRGRRPTRVPRIPWKQYNTLPRGPSVIPRGLTSRLLSGGSTFLRGGNILGGLDAFLNASVDIGLIPGNGGDIPGRYDLTGWTFACSVGYPPGKGPTYINTGSSLPGPGVPCTASAADVPKGYYGDSLNPGDPAWPPLGLRWLAFGQNNDIGPVQRMGRNEQWFRPREDEENPVPWLPPDTLADLPFRPASPDAVEDSRSFPQPGSGSFGPPPYGPPPYLPNYSGPPHLVAPPPKRTAEGKGKIPLKWWQRLVRFLANVTSEADDLIDALFSALPRWAQMELQGYSPGSPYFNQFQGKVNAVYSFLRGGHATNSYMLRATQNIIVNELTDQALGRVGRIARDLVQNNPYWVSPVGYQAGGRYRPRVTMEGG